MVGARQWKEDNDDEARGMNMELWEYRGEHAAADIGYSEYSSRRSNL